MVVKDNNEIPIPKRAPNEQEGPYPSHSLAPPADRTAAAVIDYFIILMPFLYLALAPFQRLSKEAAIVDDQWQITKSISLGVIVIVILVLVYQSFSVWLWGATPGKMVMRLRVASVWPHKKISLFQSFSRSVCWLFSLLLFGLPYFEIFSNLMRRPLHDRISDTIVLSSHQSKQASSPTSQESAIVKSVYAIFGVFLFFAIVSIISTSLLRWQKQANLISRLESEDRLCEIVGDVTSEWTMEKGLQVERLEVALTLFAADVIDSSCLEAEVTELYSSEEESSLLSLTKSMIHSEHKDLSNQYLMRVCEIDSTSPECTMSQVILAVANKDHEGTALLLGFLKPNAPAYISVWAAKHYFEIENLERAEAFLASVPKTAELNDYILPQKAKTLWGLGRKAEAKGVELASYRILSEGAKLDMSSYLCLEQIWNNCSNVSELSCQEFKAVGESLEEAYSSLTPALAYLQLWECNHPKTTPAQYESLLSLDIHSEVKQLILALNQSDGDGIIELLRDESLSQLVYVETTRRVIDQTSSRGLLKILGQEWLKQNPSMSWTKIGESLFRKLYSLDNKLESLKIINQIVAASKLNFISQDTFKKSIVAAAKLGDYPSGRKLLQKYSSLYPRPISVAERNIASADEFSWAIQILIGEQK